MKMMVRYKVKADRGDENEQLVKGVFAELARLKTPGIRYNTYRLPDGVSFVHLATVEVEPNPLFGLESFKKFTAGIPERCEEMPVTLQLGEVGAYDGLR
jgi:hypothetical protein